MKLQELNGTEVQKIHKFGHACTEIISHITKEQQSKFALNVKEMQSQVRITIDESTVNRLAYLII